MLLVMCVMITIPLTMGGKDETQALLYLSKYGYIQPSNGTQALVTEDRIKEYVTSAVKDFQAFAGLNQTGELDPVTVELMGTPRCGVRDIIGHGATAKRKKRYVLQGSRWQVNHLTYRITRYPSTARLSKRDVDETTAKAFNVWQEATGLTFEQRPVGSVHIEIRFEKYEHGDGDPFDGPGGTLAHAYFPQYGGDIHVDDTEYWTISSYRGTNLLQTMTHELGHSLGLSHSDVRSAIMAPFYRGWDPFMKLDEDDVRAIQSLYGQKVNKPPPRQTPISPAIPSPAGPGGFSPTTNNAANNICINPNINAIVKTGDGNSYIFRGDSYWKLTADSVPLVTHEKSLRTGRDCLATWTLASLGQKPRRPTSSRAISTGSSKTWHRAEATQGRLPKDSRGFLQALIPHLFGAAMARSTSSKVATIGNSTLRGNLM